MASILRECLKEPYREKAMKGSKIWMKERLFQNGAEIGKTEIGTLKEGFKN